MVKGSPIMYLRSFVIASRSRHCCWLLALTGASLRPAAAIETLAREAILVDMTTGAVLFEKNADQPMPPASMSKIMTAYLLFTKLRDGKIKLGRYLARQ